MTQLLKMYDDLKHYYNELARGNEQEVFALLDACGHLRQKWQASTQEAEALKRILQSYENDVTKARFENKELKGQLVEARSQIAGLIAARRDLEKDKVILERQVDMVRDLLRDDVHGLPEYSRKKLQFLNDRPSATILPRHESWSIISEGEGNIDYDKTGDSLVVDVKPRQSRHSNGKEYAEAFRPKRSRSATRLQPTAPNIDDMDDTPAPRKRSKDDNETKTPNADQASRGAVVATATFTIPMNGGQPRAMAEVHRTPLNRSFSEPQHLGLVQPPSVRSMKSVADLAVLSPATAPSNGRRHTFLQKTSFKAEYCDHCDRRFAFAGAMWRCEVCKMQCHSECREYALLPCIARGTPTTRNQRGILADFVPRDPPMVPNVVVHCINEIERRGPTSVGLYRVPGSEAEVNELLERFLYGRGVPNLRLVLDINVLAGCIKKFLYQLREPLIPMTSWQEFVKAASMGDRVREAMPMLHQAVIDLPQPNRDTLAFLIIHLQRVADFANENKMSISNLAKVFGPTVVGYSTSSVDLQQGINETQKQEAVMNLLLNLTPEYWGRFLTSGEYGPLIGAAITGITMGQKANTPGTSTNTLGPIGFGATFSGTPKAAPYKIRAHQKKFFNPPWK